MAGRLSSSPTRPEPVSRRFCSLGRWPSPGAGFRGVWSKRALRSGSCAASACSGALPILKVAGVILVEAPLNWVGAYVLFQAARSHERTPAIVPLAVLYVVFGFLEIANLRYLGTGVNASFAYFAFGGIATLSLALTQMLVLIERTRSNHSRDLELLHDVAQSGAVETDAEGVVARAFAAMQRRLALDGPSGREAGTWIVFIISVPGMRCRRISSPPPQIDLYPSRLSIPASQSSWTISSPAPSHRCTPGTPRWESTAQRSFPCSAEGCRSES